MGELQSIGVRNGTDKADTNHTFKGQTYLDVYERYFAPVREQVKCVLELGILGGKSLKTWRDYFPHAEVWGLDIDPAANLDYGERIHCVTGSQDDPKALDQCAPGQEFDIVVDDGSHLVVHLIASHDLLWPRVKPGGFYVMEDLPCTYLDLKPYHKVWPGQSFNPETTDMKNNRFLFDAWLKEKIGRLDGPWGDVRWIHFEAMQCWMRKVEP
jgi:hypothetical protein